MPDFKKRSLEPEILDDFELDGHDLSENLHELATVNKLLGSYPVVLSGIKALAAHSDIRDWRITDVGCGGGDVLRMLARWGRKHNYSLRLTGIDANKKAVEFARDRSQDYPEIEYRQVNATGSAFAQLEADIMIFSLFMHHLPDAAIIQVLKKAKAVGAKVLINDLQRHWLAYYAFAGFAWMFRFSPISKHDGKLSIKKGFKKTEWKHLLHEADVREYHIRWKWAFRHQVVIP